MTNWNRTNTGHTITINGTVVEIRKSESGAWSMFVDGEYARKSFDTLKAGKSVAQMMFA